MVQSRRVSLRVGSFGLTYSTERLLWEGAQGAATSSADPARTDPALADPPPVDTAPAVESERPQSQTEASTFPLDLEAAHKRALWAAAQEQAASQQTPEAQVGAGQVSGEDAGLQQRTGQGLQASGPDPLQGPVAASQLRPEQAFDPAQAHAEEGQSAGASADGAGVQAVQSERKAALTQAMRHATQAYQTCAASFACPRPMLQAVA